MMQLPDLPAGYRLVFHQSLGSTNEEARLMAAAGAPEGTAVWAGEQTAGRGRRGNDWVSPPGNMYLSVVFRPACPAAVAAQLGFVAALALSSAISDRTGLDPRLKWPNDLLLNRNKLAGILIESASSGREDVDWVVVGSGLNIASHPTALPGTTSLAAAGASVGVAEMVTTYLDHLQRWVEYWQANGFATIRDAWLARAAGRGDKIRVRLADRVEEGTFEDLDETGALVLVQGDRRQRITSGDVFPAASQ